MKRVSISLYFIFGCCIEYLREFREGDSIHEPHEVLSQIDSCLRNIEALNLKVTKNTVEPLVKFRKKLLRNRVELLLRENKRENWLILWINCLLLY